MAYSWVSVPNEWWSDIEVYSDPNVTGYTEGHLRLTSYRIYTLSNLLTDKQRRPSKIRVSYSLSGSASCPTDGYWASVVGSVAISGRDEESFSYYGDESASASFGDSLEDDLLIIEPNYFSDMSFSVTAEVYGSNESNPASASVSAGASNIEFFIDGDEEPELSPCRWTSFVGSIEVCE